MGESGLEVKHFLDDLHEVELDGLFELFFHFIDDGFGLQRQAVFNFDFWLFDCPSNHILDGYNIARVTDDSGRNVLDAVEVVKLDRLFKAV